MENLKKYFEKLRVKNAVPHCIILQGEDVTKVDEICNYLCRLILCTENNKSSYPCGKCKSCKKMRTFIHPDLSILKPEGKSYSVPVEKIREMKKDAYVIPTEGDTKVYVISSADNMTIQSQNAALKVLEEPPQGVFFILTCENSENLLETIRSRAQIFNIKAESEKSPEIFSSLAEDIIYCVLDNDKKKLILLTAEFCKDRELLGNTIQCLERKIGQLIRSYYSEGEESLKSSVNSQYVLLKLYDIVDYISENI
ncbi:MAG: hypothetical protein Q4B14_05275, partial [Clostridia bacterium]|nr:hypothetical protein [Clostridia bacterium]